jgi:hypothetical protein
VSVDPQFGPMFLDNVLQSATREAALFVGDADGQLAESI